MTGRLQNGFMFFFWGVAVIWFLTMIPNVQMPNFVQLPEFMKNTTPLGFVAAVSMIWWCFAGFETGRLQNGFMFFFWGVAIIWFLTMIPNVQMPNFVQLPEFMKNTTPLGFVAAVSMIWWCFAGFETCCAMGEEIKYPQINIPRALFLAPFIVFAVNAAF